MTATFWLTAGQTIVFLAVCGYAWWASRLIAEAADSSAQAAEQALEAANDAERTATDIREMRDMLQAWLDQQQRTPVGHSSGIQTQNTAVSLRPVRTETAEAHAVNNPEAIGRSRMDVGKRTPESAENSHHGRHAHRTAQPWTQARETLPRLTAALRAAAFRRP